MSTVRQVGIKMVVDAQSVTTEVPKAAREFDALGAAAQQASARTTRSLAQVQMSVRDIVAGAAGLHVVAGGINAITQAVLAMPRNAFDYSKQLEVSQVGMAGILGSMTAIAGHQTDYNVALGISSAMVRQLNDDALRTAATSQELTTVFQALLAPGLSARMTLDEIRQLTVVGTNAVKSMGLESGQIVQELRDLVAGGITPASSTLASALGLKDADIAAAKASSEGLFAFLMARMKGFTASSEAFQETLKGKLDQVKEGATRVAAEGMDPLIKAAKQALTDVSALFVTIEAGGKVSLNQGLIAGIQDYASTAASAMQTGMDLTKVLWDNRDAAYALGAVWASVKIGGVVADTVAATAAKVELANASRLAAAQAAVEAQGNAAVTATSAQKLAAYMAELRAKVASAEADVAAQAAQLAVLATTREAIVVARAEVVAKLDATRATMAQAEAQIAAARSAGALSFALALVREGTDTLSAAQARHAVLVAELATLGRQQAGVAASVAATTEAQAVATNAATAAAERLALAQGGASISGRAMGVVLGALGGSVGIAIAAVSALVMWLAAMNAEADRAAKVGQSKDRVAGANGKGAAAESRDVSRLASELERLKEARDELLIEQKDGPGLLSSLAPKDDWASGIATKLADTTRQIDDLEATLAKARETSDSVGKGQGALTLTLAGSEQAWRKSIDGIHTAGAAQEEYQTKLDASRQAFAQWKKQAEENGTPASEVAKNAKRQQEVEDSLARERDKKIAEQGAKAVSARGHAIDAEIAALQQGNKLLAAQVADGLDAVDSLRKQDLIDEAEQIARRTALHLQDIDGQRKAAEAELALLRGKKDSLKEQATLKNKLVELEQQRSNVVTKATRDQAEADAKVVKGLDDVADAAQAAAAQAQQRLALARDEAKEIGLVGAALGELKTARIDEAAKQLEAKALTQENIDLSGRTSEALRAQAKAMRELATTADTTAARRAVFDYTQAVEESARVVEFEQRLANVSQRDRAIAIEQYRIAIDLKKRLADIDAKTTTDPDLRARLRGEAEAAAATAQVTAASRVNLAEWDKSVDQYNDIFRKGFGDMLAHGENAWEAFTKTLANTFTTTVADQLYKAFAEPLVIDVVGNVLGFIGIGGKGGGGGGGGQQSSGVAALQGASALKTVYDSITKGVSGSVTAGFEKLANNSFGESLGLSQPVGYTTGSGVQYGLTDAGRTVGQYAGYAGNAVAGYALQKTISGGYKTNNSELVDAATVAASAYFGPIAGVVGGVYNRAFGTKLSGSGIEGTFGGSAGFSGNSYEDYKGGWFRKDKTVRSDLDPALTAGLSEGYKNLQSGVAEMGKSLGLSSKAIETYTRKIRFSTAGLTQDQIAAKLREEFSDLGDEMADLVLGTNAYTKVGESSMDALTRLSTSLTGVNATFTILGKTLYDSSLEGAEMASKLADEFGGLNAVVSASSAYFQSYYSEADQVKLRTANLTAELGSLGMSLPTTKDGFKALVDSLDLTTESGQKAYAKLLLLAPEYDAVTALNAKLAADQLRIAQENGARIAAALLATFGGQTLSDALDGQALSIAALTTNATASTSALAGTSTSLVTINRVLGDASSGTLTFSSKLDAVTTSLDPAQAAVASLQNEVDDLKLSASNSIVDMGGLTKAIGEASAAAGGFESQTFAATFVDTIAGLFEEIGARVKDTIGQIAAERQAVREAAIAIMDPSAKTGAQISAELSGVRVAGVDNSTLIAAQSALSSASVDATYWSQERAKSEAAKTAAKSAFDKAYAAADTVKKTVDAHANSFGVYFNSLALSGGAAEAKNTAGADLGVDGSRSTFDYWSNMTNENGGISGYKGRLGVMSGDKLTDQWNYWSDSQALSSAISANNTAVVAYKDVSDKYSAALATEARFKADLAAKEQTAAQAALDYTAALQQYSISSSKAVSQLGRLREETVAYYQSQKQLADGMSSGAAALRQTIADYNFSQLSSADQARVLQERFSTAYSMALSTSGETLMGYGQQLNDLINPLLQKAQDSGMSSTEYAALVSTVLARGEAVAKRLDDLAPKDYQSESLGLLGSIDSVLASLDAGAKSADQLIVDALNASKDASRAGFAAVVAALTGAAIPAFASGGYYGGGVALVGEKGPELINFANPGQVYTADQTASLLSPKQALAGSGAGMANAFAAMARQIEALSKEMAALRLENRQFGVAIATNTGKSARLADRWDGDGLPVRSAEGTTLAVAAA